MRSTNSSALRRVACASSRDRTRFSAYSENSRSSFASPKHPSKTGWQISRFHEAKAKLINEPLVSVCRNILESEQLAGNEKHRVVGARDAGLEVAILDYEGSCLQITTSTRMALSALIL